MRILILCFICFSFFSCKKDSANTNIPSTDTTSYLSSVYNYSVLDSFKYDSKHRISQLLVFDSGYHLSPLHSQVISFMFAADSSVVPSSYSIYDVQSDSTEIHQLSYDSANRIVKDTINTSGFVHYFKYSGSDTIASLIYMFAITGNPVYDQPEIDSLILTNGNVTREFRCDGTTYLGFHSTPVIYSFTSYPNPAYIAKVANSVGPLLSIIPFTGLRIVNGFNYFMSKDIVSVTTGIGTGYMESYTLSNSAFIFDSKGRITQYTTTQEAYSTEVPRFSYY